MISLEPDIGIPFAPQTSYTDLRVRAAAACATALQLQEEGLDIPDPTPADIGFAQRLSEDYATDPTGVSQMMTAAKIGKIPPPALVMASNILDQFGHAVVENAVQLRHTVTNKLIEETENPDGRIRLRALELLGKISDVGLFSDKSELTITHQTTDDLRQQLRSRLEKLIIIPDEDATEGKFIDVDDVLGQVDTLPEVPPEEGKLLDVGGFDD
tara:strand:- start:544 stop:1182 length:639 start_codon:yes stop_codon:yes gene_type:complete